MREREAKLVVGRAFEIPLGHGLAHQVASTASDTVDQHAVYFDTPDLRLTRSGASLRFRSDDGWTVKLPVRRTSSKLVRTEHAFAGERGDPPPVALSLVRAWTRSEKVKEVARIDTHRTRVRLLDKRGELLAEVADDDVIGRAGAQAETRFREIEVELSEKAPDRLLDEVVAVLRDAGARPPRAASKVERVLGDDAQAAPDVPHEEPLGRRSSVTDLVRSTLARSLRQLLDFDPELRLGGGVEAVHKSRVATRRLRSDLRTFRALLEPVWSESLRSECKWLGEILGHVRDADVLLAALEQKARQLPDEQRQAASRLIGRLRTARQRDWELLLEALDSDRYARLLDRLVAAAASPHLREGVGDKRAGKVASRIARRPRKRLRRRVRAAAPDPSDGELHEIRKAAKQARYANDALAPILGTHARNAAKRYSLVQDILGEHQDTVVAAAWLLDAARDSDDRDEAFVAGELAGSYLEDRRAARARWPAVWKRVKRVKA